MKTFKFLKMTVVALILVGFVSCNDDIDDSGDNNGLGGNASAETYLSISLSIPDGNSLKADVEDSDNHEDGDTTENEVNKVNLYFFNSSNSYVTTVALSSLELSTPGGAGSDFVTATKKKVPLDRGQTYKVFAIVNGEASVTPTSGTTVSTFLGDAFSTGVFSISVPSTGLVMASRTTTGPGVSSPWVDLAIASNNGINNPDILKLQVERTVAKLELKGKVDGSKFNEYEVEYGASGGKDATVKLTNYTVVNTTKDWFTFRHTAPDFAPSTTAPTYQYSNIEISTGTGAIYAMDPNSYLKGDLPIGSYTDWNAWVSEYNNHVDANFNGSATPVFNTAPTASDPYSGSMPTTTAYAKLGYCYENISSKDFQINGYSTGIIFKAHVTPENNEVWGVDPGDNTQLELVAINPSTTDFYYYGKEFYKDIDALNLAYTEANIAVADKDNVEKLKDEYGVDLLVKGVCYYKYWIRHLDNADPKMGVMEFAIVRNNLYKMEVKNINFIGSGTPTIDPEEENEVSAAYLNMQMSIRPWIVRTNNIDL